MLSTAPPLPENSQAAFVLVIPATDLGNQIPARGFTQLIPVTTIPIQEMVP